MFPSPASADTIVVNTLTDKADPPFNADSFCGVGTVADLPATRSLREAIIAANNTPGYQTIIFSVAGTINVNFDNLDASTAPNPLPGICDSDTTINGDNNGDEFPDIILNGAALPAGADGLVIISSRNTIRGLWLQGFPDIGIAIFHAQGILSTAPQISENTIWRNIVEGGNAGIFVQAGSVPPGFPGKVDNTIIGGNLTFDAAFRGIQVFTGDAPGSSMNSILIAGNASFSNGDFGILLFTNFTAAGSDTKIKNANVTDNLVFENGFAGIVANPFRSDNNTLSVAIARNTVTDNVVGIIVEGGDTASNGNHVDAVIKENEVSGNSNPGGTAGIHVVGGFNSSFNNHVETRILQNWVTDNTGSAITVIAGQDDSSSNSVKVGIKGNTVERNERTGITAIGGFGAAFLATGTSNNNSLDVNISSNTVRDHTRSGIAVLGGVGRIAGGAGAIADDNYVTATIKDNDVEDSDNFGIGIAAGFSGLASTNQVDAKVIKNQACDSGTTDIQVFGGFPGDAFSAPNAGTGNVAEVDITKNTATTIAAANGVAGNFAFVTQTKNAPCP